MRPQHIAVIVTLVVSARAMPVQAQTRTTSVTLSAERLELDANLSQVCAERARLSSCGGCESPWSVSARRVILREGGDVDLTGPVLRIGRVPLMALPWVRIRTGRRWGLLVPRIGFRAGGGFEVGQGVWGPLGPRADLMLSAAYLTEIVGTEIAAEVHGRSGSLRVTGVAGRNGYDASLSGRGHARHGPVEVAGELQWHLDPELARALSRSLVEEARQVDVSLASFVQNNDFLQVALTTTLLRDLDAMELSDATMSLSGLSMHLLPVGAGPFTVELRGATELTWSPNDTTMTWPRWLVSAEPALDLGLALGPLATHLGVATLHALWHEHEEATTPDFGRHVVAASLDLSLPLVKRLGNRGADQRHLFEPTIRYRIILADSFEGDLPIDVLDESRHPATWPVAGHFVWLGLINDLRRLRTGMGLRFELGQRLDLPAPLGGLQLPHQLDARIQLEGQLTQLTMALAVLEQPVELGEALAGVLLGARDGAGIEVEWRWLQDTAMTSMVPDSLAPIPTVIPLDALGAAHTLSSRGWITIRRTIRLEAGVHLDLEGQSLLVAGGGVSYEHRCGCLSASLQASYRPWRRWPDVIVAVDLAGLGRR